MATICDRCGQKMNPVNKQDVFTLAIGEDELPLGETQSDKIIGYVFAGIELHTYPNYRPYDHLCAKCAEELVKKTLKKWLEK